MPIILTDISSFLMNSFFIVLGVWFVVLIIALITLVRRRDLPVPVKIFWGLVILIAPVVGLILYLLLGISRKKNRQVSRYS